MDVRGPQPVTAPISNAQFSEFEGRWAACEARIEARFTACEAKIEARFTTCEEKMDQKFDRLRLQLIIAIILSNAAMGPLGAALLEALKRAFQRAAPAPPGWYAGLDARQHNCAERGENDDEQRGRAP